MQRPVQRLVSFLLQLLFFRSVEKQPNRVSQRQFRVGFGQAWVEPDRLLEQLNHPWIILSALQMRRGAPREDPGVLQIRLCLGPTLGTDLHAGSAVPGLALDGPEPERSQCNRSRDTAGYLNSSPTLLAGAFSPDRPARFQERQVGLQFLRGLITLAHVTSACFQ